MNNNFLLFLAKEMPIDVLVNLVRTTSDEYLSKLFKEREEAKS